MLAQPEGRTRSAATEAALHVLDERGLDAFMTRRLDGDLGAVSVPLDDHFASPDELLDAVARLLLSDVHDDLGRPRSWQAYLHAVAHAMRRAALRHPRAFPLVATQPGAAPWLWPPLRDVALVEQLVSNLLKSGFSEEQAARTYRTFINFLLGQLLLEAALQRTDETAEHGPLHDGRSSTPTSGSATLRLRSALAEDRDKEVFEIRLEHLLDRLELEVAPLRQQPLAGSELRTSRAVRAAHTDRRPAGNTRRR